MHLILAAVGRMKKGPEQELADRYCDCVSKSGKAIGISQVKIVENRASTADVRKQGEADALLARLPDDCTIFAFDERGKSPDSRQFAKMVSSQLDHGSGALVLIIGGPDGLSPVIPTTEAIALDKPGSSFRLKRWFPVAQGDCSMHRPLHRRLRRRFRRSCWRAGWQAGTAICFRPGSVPAILMAAG